MTETTVNLLGPYQYGRGWPELQSAPNPGAGTGSQVTVPGGEVWRLVAAYGQLATSATVANRTIVLDIKNNDGLIWAHLPASVVTAASTTVNFQFLKNGASAYAGGDSTLVIPIPDLMLQAGTIWYLNAASLQAGDQFSNIHYYVERFRIGPGEYESGRSRQFPALVDP